MNVAYNTDCLEAMRAMPDKHFDLAVVDPPYGLNINHNMGRRKGRKPSDYKKVTWDTEPPPLEYFQQLARVSKNQIIFGANHFVSRIPAPDSHCWICWDKGFSEDVSFASFELAWTSFDRPCKRLALSSNQTDRIHPAQKPVALYAWIFARFAKPGDKILDTHLGSGSSRIAAYNAGLDFVGYEIDKDHYASQEQRYKDHTAQLSLFGGGGTPFSTHSLCIREKESHLRPVLSTRRRWRYISDCYRLEIPILYITLQSGVNAKNADGAMAPYSVGKSH